MFAAVTQYGEKKKRYKYLMQEGVVCDCTGGGVDAEQPPHINDPVRGNSLHQAKKEYLLLKSCIKENKQCRKN